MWAPSQCKLGQRGGGCAWLGVSAMRTRVWAAGGVKAILQELLIPNFQDCDNVLCLSHGKPQRAICMNLQAICGYLEGRYAWAAAAQFLPHDSVATQFSVALSMQMGGELITEQA
eukprot:1160105-Pelagomonas_calceolata.AAC.10